MTSLKKLAGQTAIYGLSSIVGRLINYLLVPLYTYSFAEAEYGIVTEFYAYAGFFAVILGFGMETAFFRFINKSEESAKSVFATAQWMILSLVLSWIFAVFIFHTDISELLGYASNPFYVLSFGLILGMDAVSNLPFANLRKEEKALRFAGIKVINILVNVGINLFFIVLCPWLLDHGLFQSTIRSIYNPEFGIGYIFLANLCASAVTVLLLLRQFDVLSILPDPKLLKKMIFYALPLILVGMAGIVNETLDRVLLKYLLPGSREENLQQLGIYGACYKLSILMTLFIQAYRYAAEPFFFSQSKEQHARTTYARMLKYFVVAGGFVFILVSGFLPLFKYFIGPEYREGLAVVPVLLLANWLLGAYYSMSIWYKLAEKTIFGAYISLIGAGLTIVLNILLIPYFGYMGSAWATLACYFVMVLLSAYWGHLHFPIPYDYLMICFYFILAIVIYGFFKAFLDKYLIHTILNLGVKAILILAYPLVIWMVEGGKIPGRKG